MSVIVYKGFMGEQPRLEPHLLPEAAAQLALNVEFESGALTPTKSGTLLTTLLSNPVKGLYTEDGVSFFSWPVEAQTFISPVIEDAYNRMYYLLPSEGLLRTGLKAEMAANGPTPATVFQAGVPQPTVAPVATLIQRTDLPEYPGATVTVTAWWESAGIQYGSTAVALTTLTPFLAYSFALPAVPTGTPSGASLGAKLMIRDASSNILVSVTLAAGSTSSSRGLPGGVEIGLANDGAGKILLLWGATETRAYTYTNQNTWLEEGAPAPPITISPNYTQDVQLSLVASDFTSYRSFGQFNIYRTYGTGTTYIKTLATAIGITGLVWLDSSRKPGSVSSALESADWFPPPTGLQGMVALPNGWFAAFKGNDLHLSEPYRPHAWPYVQKFPHAIRGVYPTQQALVVTTAAGVYLLVGANPVGTSQIRLSLPQPGVSQRSMTAIDGAVAYATNDGFALVAGSDATMAASQKLFTRKTWRALYGDVVLDSSLRFAYYDGNLIATSSSTAKGFALRLDEDIGAYSRLNVRMDSTFWLPVNDTLYYSVGQVLYSFRTGATQAMDWWGRDFIYAKPTTFGAGYIRSDMAVTMTLYADGVQVYSTSVSPGYFTLPDINAALRWSVRFSGTAKISEFAMARTMKDLNHV
jgi:hypothetical protein